MPDYGCETKNSNVRQQHCLAQIQLKMRINVRMFFSCELCDAKFYHNRLKLRKIRFLQSEWYV